MQRRTYACFICGEVDHLKLECPLNLARQHMTSATKAKWAKACFNCGADRMPRYKSDASFAAHQTHCRERRPPTPSDAAGTVAAAALGSADGASSAAMHDALLMCPPRASSAARCKFFAAGRCRKGLACKFIHAPASGLQGGASSLQHATSAPAEAPDRSHGALRASVESLGPLLAVTPPPPPPRLAPTLVS
jgi:hypothetical protein